MSHAPVSIVVPDDYPAAFTGSAAEPRLRALGTVRVFTERGADDPRVLADRIGDAVVAINIRAHAHFTAEVLARCPSLRLISIWGTGTDNVDLSTCAARGITVCNTPGANAAAVAEHTLALMLAVSRRIPALDREVRAGRWPRGLLDQLDGRTLGVVGFGAIGRRMTALGAAVGMRVLVSTWRGGDGRVAAAGFREMPLDALLGEADVVTLHLRLTDDTRGLFTRERLARMKPTAYLVNTARGALVDRAALIDALTSGTIAGAALDVFHEEPLPVDDPLLALPNVVLSPHNAGMTREVIETGLVRAVDNVAAFLAGTPVDVVVGPPG